uniref:Uncharacterized protein n=1 Tax=Vibrio tasmaniensis TaxID=212663 RepID=A0A0H4A0N1_9VIBR|nr:hypothetical protein [Vibrio tasmaniensis]
MKNVILSNDLHQLSPMSSKFTPALNESAISSFFFKLQSKPMD